MSDDLLRGVSYLADLQRLQVTDIFNVSEVPSQLKIDDGPFRSVNWYEIQDHTVIPNTIALKTLDAIHQAITAPAGCLYIHCMAGWHRSPTFILLYMLACGIDSETGIQKDL